MSIPGVAKGVAGVVTVTLLSFFPMCSCGCGSVAHEAGAPLTPSAVADSKRSGSQIARALKSYYDDHGNYPKQLSDLVPKHIASIQPPAAGVPRWFYETSEDGKEFLLQFGSLAHTYDRPYPSWGITSREFKWINID